MSEEGACGHRHSHSTASGTSSDEVWLAATWDFIREQLPAPPARVVELGCGRIGGHVPALLRDGYDATGVDPEAPEGPTYRQVAFEDYRPDGPADAVIASVSLHHVDDLGAALDHICDVLAPGGRMIVVEWISEEFDEATAQWCFRHRIRDPDEPGAWLAGLRARWVESGLPWETFFRERLEQHGLHPAAAIRQELRARFVTTHESTAPYYFPDLLDVDAVVEQAAIDAGEIRAGCLRYTGRQPGRDTERLRYDRSRKLPFTPEPGYRKPGWWISRVKRLSATPTRSRAPIATRCASDPARRSRRSPCRGWC